MTDHVCNGRKCPARKAYAVILAILGGLLAFGVGVVFGALFDVVVSLNSATMLAMIIGLVVLIVVFGILYLNTRSRYPE